MTSGSGWEHERRRTSFGAIAEAYAAVRPDWPAPTVAWLTGTDSPTGGSSRTGGDTPTGGGLDVLDLGAGTGKLTTALLAAGHRVVAVDPSPQMLGVLAQVAPAADVRAGTAEQIPAGDRSVDVVTVGQAWHWFDQRRAAAECVRVLRPGGLLSVAWHARDERVGWVRELSDLAGRPDRPADAADPGAPDPGERAAPEQFELPDDFGPVAVREFGYRQRLSVEELVTQASTWSYVAVSPDRAAILQAVRALGHRVAGPDGTLVVPHRTWCYRARVAGRASGPASG